MARPRKQHPTVLRSTAAVQKAADVLLEGVIQPIRLAPRQFEFRTHDDCDGRLEEAIGVGLSVDGDVWLRLPPNVLAMRFRTYIGGGQSPRVRNALLLLAEAIRRDNELRPQKRPG
jgi:hypothetical protein